MKVKSLRLPCWGYMPPMWEEASIDVAAFLRQQQQQQEAIKEVGG
jgi:hypothetical protein